MPVRAPRNRGLLWRTVDELVAIGAIDEPDERPVYVQMPEPGEGVGWYWTPAGGGREVLGHNVYSAYAQLLTLRST
jgi:hypothetical protein